MILTIESSLKSFKIFPRKGSIKRETTGGDGSGVTLRSDDEKKGTPEERAKLRAENFERRVRVASERLPEGWKVKRSKNFVASCPKHVLKRFAKHSRTKLIAVPCTRPS